METIFYVGLANLIGCTLGLFIGYCYYVTGDKETAIICRNACFGMPFLFALLVLACAVFGY